MPRGASPKRGREYRELKHRFKEEGRYKGREEEVASRILNKQRSGYGETKDEKRKDRQGKSPDRNLPIAEYQHKTVSEIRNKLKGLSNRQIDTTERYESKHKDRKGVHQAISDAKKAA